MNNLLIIFSNLNFKIKAINIILQNSRFYSKIQNNLCGLLFLDSILFERTLKWTIKVISKPGMNKFESIEATQSEGRQQMLSSMGYRLALIAIITTFMEQVIMNKLHTINCFFSAAVWNLPWPNLDDVSMNFKLIFSRADRLVWVSKD